MARMYSRKHGTSGSKKPAKKVNPSWTKYKGKEVELLVGKLYKEGKPGSQIGLLLRDTYGIPSVKTLCGPQLNEILEEKKLVPEMPEDVQALFKKYALVKKHIDTNKKDQTAARGLNITASKINKLVKYYKRKGRIAETWKFDADRMGFFAE